MSKTVRWDFWLPGNPYEGDGGTFTVSDTATESEIEQKVQDCILAHALHTGAAQGDEMTARAEDVLQRHGEAARELLDTLDVLYQYANDLDRVTRHNRAELAVAVWLDARSISEPQMVCEWRPYEFRNGNYYALVGTCCETAEGLPMLRRAVKKWKCCPYCTLPLKLSPESPNEDTK